MGLPASRPDYFSQEDLERRTVNTVQAAESQGTPPPMLGAVTPQERRRFWIKVRKTETCWFWTADAVTGGYGRFCLNGNKVLAHRAAWVLAHGAIPHGLCILHSCDQPACVRVTHMRLGTYADNTADCHAKGRRSYQRGTMPRGDTHKRAKLTSAAVAAIRAAAATGEVVAVLAQRYGISPVHVRRIIRRESWAF
jgi:hypothetical protein